MPIDPIASGETGLSARTKLNSSLAQSSSIIDTPEGALLMKGASAAVASALVQGTDSIQSTMTLEAPDGGAYRMGNFEIGNAGFNIVAEELSTGTQFFPVSYFLQTEGSSRPAYENFGAVAVTPAAVDTSETFTGNQVQFAIVNVNRGYADQYTLLIPDGAAEVTDCNLTIRTVSHTNEPAIFDYKRATGGTGFTLPANSTGSNIDGVITLPRIAFFQAGLNIFVTLEAGTGQTLSVVGQTWW